MSLKKISLPARLRVLTLSGAAHPLWSNPPSGEVGLAIQPTAAPPNPSYPALCRLGKYTHGNGATLETTTALEICLAPVVNNRLCDHNPSLSDLTTSGSVQAMVVSRGWVFAGEGLRK